jgi:ABC-2 type transport system permease protein
MRETTAMFKKELRTFFVGPIPYFVAALFALVATWLVFEKGIFLVLRRANLDSLFGFLPWLFTFFVPFVSMRTWAEEIRGETIETLMTAPVRVRHLVFGKFFAALVVLALCLASTIAIPITAASLGDLDVGPLIGGYLGALLMAGAYLALGQWLSSLTRNQIIAAIAAMVVFVGLMFLDSLGSTAFTGSFGSFMTAISMKAHFDAIARGVLDLRDLAYFASVIGFFLYLNVETLENRRHA